MAQRSWAEVRVGPQGRLVIPVELRKALELEPGEVLVGRVEDKRLVLERRAAVLERLQARVAAAVPEGVSLVDELIAERREEARRESEDR
jgi:AbrB family looped-hinge helix DNA binding protein